MGSEGIRRIAALTYPIVYERGTRDDPNWYEVEIEFLEKNERYIQISILSMTVVLVRFAHRLIA
jgi:hypothetical protein